MFWHYPAAAHVGFDPQRNLMLPIDDPCPSPKSFMDNPDVVRARGDAGIDGHIIVALAELGVGDGEVVRRVAGRDSYRVRCVARGNDFTPYAVKFETSSIATWKLQALFIRVVL